MKRIHAFEFEDLQWFPAVIRDYGTEYYRFVADRADYYRHMLPAIKKGLEKSGGDVIVDIGSGAGGGWARMAGRLKREIPALKVTLTDLYPNYEALASLVRENPEIFTFENRSVSALDVPADLKGFRTLFLSFHHFRPKQARQVLQNAVDNMSAIGVVETQVRSAGYVFRFSLAPLAVMLVTPFIRPFKLGRLLFTYILPIVPLFVLWDALVSVLRTYTETEIREMIGQLDGADSFEWEFGRHKHGLTTIQYFLGYPKEGRART